MHPFIVNSYSYIKPVTIPCQLIISTPIHLTEKQILILPCNPLTVNAISLSMSIIYLYSTESHSMSTVLSMLRNG